MIIKLNEQGEQVGLPYKSIREAGRDLGVAHQSIMKVLDKDGRTSCGFQWKTTFNDRNNLNVKIEEKQQKHVRKSNDVTLIRIPANKTNEWEQWVLLTSDEHFDSKHCDRELLKKHHDLAKSKNAIILKFGDIFDAMGGKYDPRSNKSSLRPEYHVDDYFDAIVRDAADFYGEYKSIIHIISYGNHELSILKRQEIDVINNLAQQLGGVNVGKYSGFIRFIFDLDNEQRKKTLYYNHGSGGNSPVTRGVIKTNRRQSFIQSDFFVSGHIHNEWALTLPIVKLNDNDEIEKGEQVHISLGTYKDDSFSGGWADHNEFPPPNKGGAWIRFYWDDEIKHDIIRAK